MAVWTDQTRTMERKLDLLNRWARRDWWCSWCRGRRASRARRCHSQLQREKGIGYISQGNGISYSFVKLPVPFTLPRCHEKFDLWEARLSAVDALNHKLTALDKKINAMTRLEFKVEQVSERIEEVRFLLYTRQKA